MISHVNLSEPFVRHRGPVTGVAMIPGTSWVASSGYDGAVARFDLEEGSVKLFGYHDHLVNHVTTNVTGTLIASSSSDYSVRLWCARTGRSLQRLVGHSDDVEAFVFIDDATGASASRDRRIIIWDLRDGSPKRELMGHDEDVLSLTCLGGRLLSAGDDKTLRVWDLQSGAMEICWGPFENETDTCAVDVRRARAVLGCDDGYLRQFDLKSGAMIDEVAAHTFGIKKVAVSAATGDVLSASYDNRIVVWDGDCLTKKFDLDRLPATWERSLTWSSDGRRLLGGSFDGTVLAWEADTGRLIAEIGRADKLGNACFNDVGASQDGYIVAVADDGRVRLARNGGGAMELLHTFEPPQGRILMNAVALDPQRRRVAAGAHNHTLQLFQIANERLEPQATVNLGHGPVNTVRFAPDGKHSGQIFSGCYSGHIVLVGPEASVIAAYRLHEGAVKSLRLHADREMGVSCSADGSLLGWSYDGELLQQFHGHHAIINDVDLAPDGRRLCSVSRDFALKIYDLDSGRMDLSIDLGTQSLKSVCFFSNDLIFVGNYWGYLMRVDLSTLDVQRRRLSANGISALAKARSGIIACSYDGSIDLVDPDTLEVVHDLVLMTQRPAIVS